jgi:gamma-glutamylcyclotransferase (GGCT)/AIG2-like uncharacterized protein YtfP
MGNRGPRLRDRIDFPPLADLVFFYGTLMTPFNRPGRQRVNPKLRFTGHGSIRAALFDLGIYPAAIPSDDGGLVHGEVYQMQDPVTVLATLDEIEGYRATEPESSLYMRVLTPVTLDAPEDGQIVSAWAYFYNAPLGRAARIASGDYLDHLNVRS